MIRIYRAREGVVCQLRSQNADKGCAHKKEISETSCDSKAIASLNIKPMLLFREKYFGLKCVLGSGYALDYM